MKKIIYLDKPTEYANALAIDVYYDKGGRNYFTCKDERRAYYLSVCPVLLSDVQRNETLVERGCTQERESRGGSGRNCQRQSRRFGRIRLQPQRHCHPERGRVSDLVREREKLVC